MLFLTLLALFAGVALGAAPVRDKPFYPEAAHAQHFAAFKTTYNKQYTTPEEEQHRFQIFKNNLNEINQLNAKYEETVYGINAFADLTSEEVIAQYTGLAVDTSRVPMPPPPTNFSSVEVPADFDWRDKKIVSRVKNQGRCGSCWAFSTIGGLEAHYAKKSNKLVEFSEQQLVDCSTTNGCLSGSIRDACSYIIEKGELTESDYPYRGKQESCQYKGKKVVTHAVDCQDHAGISEEDLKALLYNKGPLSITIDADNIHTYKHGVLMKCAPYQQNHAVLLVGYGTEAGVPYWTIKNSWGESWGAQGYIKIHRGVHCLGISTGPGAEIVAVAV